MTNLWLGAFVALNLLLSSGVCYLMIGRANKMDRSTRPAVQWSVAGLGATAFAVAIAPLVWGLKCLIVVVTVYQLAHVAALVSMRHLWQDGTPHSLRKPGAPRERHPDRS